AGGVETILLLRLQRGEALLPVPDDDVAGRAGAVPSALVLDPDAVMERDVEKGAGLPAVPVREILVVDLHRAVGRPARDAVARHGRRGVRAARAAGRRAPSWSRTTVPVTGTASTSPLPRRSSSAATVPQTPTGPARGPVRARFARLEPGREAARSSLRAGSGA